MRRRRPIKGKARRRTNAPTKRKTFGINNTPIPKQRVINIRTTVSFQLAGAGTGLFATQLLAGSLNGANGISATPIGDMWGQFYTWYTVLGSKLSLSVSNAAVTALPPVVCGTYLDLEAATSGPSMPYNTYALYIQQGRGTYKQLNQSSTIGTHHFKNTYSLKKSQNLLSAEDDQQNYGSNILPGTPPRSEEHTSELQSLR